MFFLIIVHRRLDFGNYKQTYVFLANSVSHYACLEDSMQISQSFQYSGEVEVNIFHFLEMHSVLLTFTNCP